MQMTALQRASSCKTRFMALISTPPAGGSHQCRCSPTVVLLSTACDRVYIVLHIRYATQTAMYRADALIQCRCRDQSSRILVLFMTIVLFMAYLFNNTRTKASKSWSIFGSAMATHAISNSDSECHIYMPEKPHWLLSKGTTPGAVCTQIGQQRWVKSMQNSGSICSLLVGKCKHFTRHQLHVLCQGVVFHSYVALNKP